MQRKAKIFMNNRSQAVLLPKEFRLKTQEVFIRREGNDVMLSPRSLDWSGYLAEGSKASPEFMENVTDWPVQGRDLRCCATYSIQTIARTFSRGQNLPTSGC